MSVKLLKRLLKLTRVTLGEELVIKIMKAQEVAEEVVLDVMITTGALLLEALEGLSNPELKELLSLKSLCQSKKLKRYNLGRSQN